MLMIISGDFIMLRCSDKSYLIQWLDSTEVERALRNYGYLHVWACITIVTRPFCLVKSSLQDAAANAGVLFVYLTYALYYHLQLFIDIERDLVSIYRVSLLDLLATINLYYYKMTNLFTMFPFLINWY